MPRTRYQNTDDIPGLTARLTTPFVIVSVVIGMIWLVLNGLLDPLWAWMLGIAASAGLVAGQLPLFKYLLGNNISRPGCLIGLYMYGIGLVGWIILAWLSGWPGALFGILLVPICCFGSATFVSARNNDPRSGNARKGRGHGRGKR